MHRDFRLYLDDIMDAIQQIRRHGIDIDLRATQIAALALWPRCHRAYQELGLKSEERPKITRSNIVCAEPIPGETDRLKEFPSALQPKALGQLVEAVFEKMKLAGEAASKVKFEFTQWKEHQDKAKWSPFPELVKRYQLDFDLNDGVILNIAPLWELVPWKEPQKYWEELKEGKYSWSHIASQLWPERVKEACKKGRSISIAHDLENEADP